MEQINLAKDTISIEDINSLCEWLKTSPRLTKSKLTDQLESEFCDYLNTSAALLVNSGSSANMLCVQSLIQGNFLKNNIAIAPAVSWVTTVTLLLQSNMSVHLCETDKQNLGLDIDHFKYLVKKHNPGLVVLVHVLGHSNHMEEIVKICNDNKIYIMEDSCEALGSHINGKYLGTTGIVGTYSFYYGHQMSTIEGGLVITNNSELSYIMKSIRAHGWSRDIPPGIKNKWGKEYGIDRCRDLYTFYYSGYNFRATEIQAHLGLLQLKKLSKFTEHRHNITTLYKKYLPSTFFHQSSDTTAVACMGHATLVKNRLQVFDYLQQNNIETRPLICGNVGRQPFWLKVKPPFNSPHADLVHEHGIYLPCHSDLTLQEVEYICKKFLEIAKPIHFK